MVRVILIALIILGLAFSYSAAKTGLGLHTGLGPNSGGTVGGPVVGGIDYDATWSVYTDAWTTNYTSTWK